MVVKSVSANYRIRPCMRSPTTDKEKKNRKYHQRTAVSTPCIHHFSPASNLTLSQSIHLFLFLAQIKVTTPPLTSPNTFAPQGYPHNQTAQASKEAVPVVHLLSCFTLHQLHELVSSTTPAARIWSFVIVIVLLRDQICESLLISLGSALVLQQHLHFSETPLLQAF